VLALRRSRPELHPIGVVDGELSALYLGHDVGSVDRMNA